MKTDFFHGVRKWQVLAKLVTYFVVSDQYIVSSQVTIKYAPVVAKVITTTV